MGMLARPDIRKALEPYRPHRIEIADDGGRPLHLLHDVAELKAVEELAMAQMHIGDGHAANGNDLRQTRRHPARQDRIGQPDGGGVRQGMRTPGRQAVDARLHRMAEKMPAHQRREGGDVLGAFLQQKQIGMMAFDQPGDILDTRADPAQQIPTNHPQAIVGGMGSECGSHQLCQTLYCI